MQLRALEACAQLQHALCSMCIRCSRKALPLLSRATRCSADKHPTRWTDEEYARFRAAALSERSANRIYVTWRSAAGVDCKVSCSRLL